MKNRTSPFANQRGSSDEANSLFCWPKDHGIVREGLIVAVGAGERLRGGRRSGPPAGQGRGTGPETSSTVVVMDIAMPLAQWF